MTKHLPQSGGVLPATIETGLSTAPASIKARAVTWLTKVLGYGLIPEKAQKISTMMAEAKGRETYYSELAKQLALQDAVDPEIMARAATRMLGREAVRQQNLESIVAAAAPKIAELEQPAEILELAAPSDDWVRKFSELAGDVSDKDLQEAWARVLAGEYEEPGSYSLRTLRLLSELDRQTAELFELVAKNQFGGDAIYTPSEWGEGEHFLHLKQLKDAGLVQDDPSGSTRFSIKSDSTKSYGFVNHEATLIIYGEDNAPQRLNVGISLLTKAGRELLGLLEPPDSSAILRVIADTLREPWLPAALIRSPVKDQPTNVEFLWGSEEDVTRMVGRFISVPRPKA